jgi:hypothetical protein
MLRGTRGRPRPQGRSDPVAQGTATESLVVFCASFGVYIAAAVYLVLHLELMNGDAYSRVVSAWNVLYSRDPHLAALGLVWPPLPSLLDLPPLLFKGWFPALVTQGFAGSIEAAAFSAGTVVLLNGALRRSGVSRVRWLLLAAWVANPMTVWYGVQGMSEAMFVFFTVAAILCFLRWCDTGTSLMLFGAGTAMGLDNLVRNETAVLALALAAAIAIRSLSRRASPREVETQLMLYGLPVLLCIGIFVGANWAIKGDPLFFVHSTYGNAAQAAAVGGHFGGADARHWGSAAAGIVTSAAVLFPAVIPLMALLALRTLVVRNRVTGLLLLALAMPVFALDVVLRHAAQFPLFLRYFIYVIPYAFLVALYLLAELRRSRPRLVPWAALAMTAMLGVSNLVTALVMTGARGLEENDVLPAALHNLPHPSTSADGRYVAGRVAGLDRGHRLVVVDDFVGYSVAINAPDPSIFVITSDEDFEPALTQPLVYHIGYFLVPRPRGVSTMDRLNQLYPELWATGGGFATLTADIGGGPGWRLYRIDRDPQAG